MSGERRPNREAGAARKDSNAKATPVRYLIGGTVETDSEADDG